MVTSTSSLPSTTSPFTTTSSSPAAAPIATQWALRTRLTGELREIETCIRQWGRNDETTQLIDRWRNHFTQALHTNQDERETLRTHIDLMQRLLRDPISREPFTDDAVLGSDGNSYSQETIDVYGLPNALPAEWRGRSPLDIEDPRPFTTTPHLVIPHMIGWLRSHNSLLLPTAGQPPQSAATAEARQARIQRIAARTEEARRGREQSGTFRQQLNERLSAFQIELDQMIAPLREQTQRLTREGTQQLDALASRDAQQVGIIRTQIAQMAELDQQALSSSAGQLEQADARRNATLEASRQNLTRSIQEDRNALQHVAQRVQESVADQRLAPLAEGIGAYAQVASELGPIAHQLEVNTRQVQHSIRQLNQEIYQLDEEDREHQHNLNDVSARLDDVQRQEIQLRRDMIQTERAIREQEKSHKGGFMKTALIIGGACLFVCWGMTALAEGGLSAGVTLKAGGAAAIGVGVGVSSSGRSKRQDNPHQQRPPQHRLTTDAPPSTDRSSPAPSETPLTHFPSREDFYARLGGRLGPPTSWLQERDAVSPLDARRPLGLHLESRESESVREHNALPDARQFSSHHESPENNISSDADILHRRNMQNFMRDQISSRFGRHIGTHANRLLSTRPEEEEHNRVRNWVLSAEAHVTTAEVVRHVLPNALPTYRIVAGAHMVAELAAPLESRVQQFLNTASPEDYALPPQLSAEALDLYQAAQVAGAILHVVQMPSHALHDLHDQIEENFIRAADSIGLTDQSVSEAIQRDNARRINMNDPFS